MTIFAHSELVSAIERAESRLLRAAITSMRGRDPAADVVEIECAGGLATFTEPGSPLNKVAGVGLAGQPDDAVLDAIERESSTRGIPVQFELASHGDASFAARLVRRGYAFAGVENVLGRPITSAERFDDVAGSEVAAIEVADSALAELDEWIGVVATGFASPDREGVPSEQAFEPAALRRAMRDFVQADGVRRFAARREGILVGGGCVRFAGIIAQFCGAATLPESRRRGVQTALLATRLRAARDAGCELAVMTTQPGSKSHQNGVRRGFGLLYVRNVFVRAP